MREARGDKVSLLMGMEAGDVWSTATPESSFFFLLFEGVGEERENGNIRKGTAG